MDDMKTVQIAEVEADPRAYLESLRRGEEMIVCDGEKPLARILPIAAEDADERRQRLIAKGVIGPRLEPPPEEWPGPAKGPVIPDEVMQQIWREERDGR